MRLQHLQQILMLQNITIMTLKPVLTTVSHIVFVIWKVSFDFGLFHVVRNDILGRFFWDDSPNYDILGLRLTHYLFTIMNTQKRASSNFAFQAC